MTDKRIVNALYAFEIPKIPRPDTLPALPQIEDPDLMRIATTHTSLRAQQRRRGDLEEDETFSEDYEKLEHVGDALLGSIVVTLLHDLFPRFREGTAAMIKDQLVRNTTLAQFAEWYGIENLIRADPSCRLAVKGQTKTKGSMFEAYVAGLYYSYTGQNPLKLKDNHTLVNQASSEPAVETTIKEGGANSKSSVPETLQQPRDTHGVQEGEKEAAPQFPEPKATQPQDQVIECSLQDLLSMPEEPTPPSSVVAPKPLTAGEGYDRLSAWLRPLFTPVAHFALTCMRAEAARLSQVPLLELPGRQCAVEWLEEDEKSASGLSLLAIHVQKYKLKSPTIHAHQREEGGLWEVKLTLEDILQVMRQTEGTRYTKRGAAQIAAFKMCQLIGIA